VFGLAHKVVSLLKMPMRVSTRRPTRLNRRPKPPLHVMCSIRSLDHLSWAVRPKGGWSDALPRPLLRCHMTHSNQIQPLLNQRLSTTHFTPPLDPRTAWSDAVQRGSRTANSVGPWSDADRRTGSLWSDARHCTTCPLAFALLPLT